MKLAVFIDYDNLLEIHRASGILNVTTRALLQTRFDFCNDRGSCDIRIYGGWYEGQSMTQRAQDLAVMIGSEFPAIIRIPHRDHSVVSIATNAELAMSMMEEPSHHLLDTYRKKGKPGNLRVQKPAEVGCTEPLCPLPMAKKLLKNGSCPLPACSVNATDLVYRHEQKIVDTMLACDMVFATRLNYKHVVLVSDDDDFLPPIRTLILRGIPVSRFHPKPSRLRNPVIIRGMQLSDIDL